MTYPLFSFNSTQQSSQDPSVQAGLNQYLQQGQGQISPGQAQVAQSSPISAAAMSGLANALKTAPQQGPQGTMPMQVSQAALGAGAQMNPNVGGQNMGGVGPTPQNLAIANMLQNPSQPSAAQQFMNPQGN